VKVSVANVRVEHEVRLLDFTKWLEKPGGSPREVTVTGDEFARFWVFEAFEKPRYSLQPLTRRGAKSMDATHAKLVAKWRRTGNRRRFDEEFRDEKSILDSSRGPVHGDRSASSHRGLTGCDHLHHGTTNLTICTCRRSALRHLRLVLLREDCRFFAFAHFVNSD
jgi:hypothetical protein